MDENKEDGFNEFQEKIGIEGDLLKRYEKLISKHGEEFKNGVAWSNELFKASNNEELNLSTEMGILLSMMLRQEYYLVSILNELRKSK